MRMRVLPAIVVVVLSIVGLVMLAGCAMTPTATPVALRPTSTPAPIVQVTAAPLTVPPTAPLPASSPTPIVPPTRYPLPESPTGEPASYPSAGPTLVTSQATPMPIKPPTEAPPNVDVMRRLAPVDEVQVNIMESFPVQVSLTIYGFLGDGCTKLTGITQSRSADEIVFQAVSERPRGAVCTKALVPYEENVPLDLTGLGVGAHVLSVNGVTTTLELSDDMLGPLADAENLCKPPERGIMVYRAREFGYCLSYPSDMVICKPDATRVMVLRILDDGLRAPQAVIIELLGPSNGATLKELVSLRMPTDVPVEQARVELGGDLAIEVTSPDIPSLRQIYVLYDDALYVMWSVGATESDWDTVSSTFSFD